MASHVRRFSRFGADAPHHFGALRPGPRRPFPAHGAPWTVRGRWPLQERGSIGSQYHCSKIGSPLATKPRRARLSGLARQNDPVKNRPASELPAPLASCPRDPGCAAPFSSRIPTGARTDSGEVSEKKVLREGRRHGLFLTPKRVWLDLVAYGEPAKGRARRGLRRSPPSQR